MEVRVEAREDSGGAVCVFCRDRLQAERGAACEACGARFHRACLGASRACPTLGCPGRLTGLYPPLSGRAGRGRRSLEAMVVFLGLFAAGASLTAVLVRVMESARQRAAVERELRERAEPDRQAVERELAARRQREAALARWEQERARQQEEARRREAAARDQRRRAEEAREAARPARAAEAGRQLRAQREAPPPAQAPASSARPAPVERTTGELEAEARVVMRSILDALRRGEARSLEASASPAARERLSEHDDGWSSARVTRVQVVSATAVVDLAAAPVRVEVEVRRDADPPGLLLGLWNRGGAWLLEEVRLAEPAR